MKLRYALLATLLAPAITLAAEARAAEEAPDGTGQVGAAGKSVAEKMPVSDGQMEAKPHAPAEKYVVNYEELFGCKPMEGTDGHEHTKEKH